MELFELKNNKVQIHPAAYTMGPFKPIVNQKNKTKALKELAYIFFTTDYKSDFSDILNEDEKQKEVKRIVELPESWEPSEKIEAAIVFYKERQRTPSMHLLETTLNFTEKLKNFYDRVDLFEVDDKGKPIHNVQQLQKSAAEVGLLTESIKKLKEAVAKEVEEASRVRGGGEIGFFEDPE